MSNIIENDIKILKLLLDNNGAKFTIKKIAEAININYRIAHERVGALGKEGLLRATKIGNAKLCEFTSVFNNKVYEAEYLRQQSLFRNKDLLVLRNRLAELDFVFAALIFGSHAKGSATARSDIDLLTIGGDLKEIEATVSLWPQRIHLTSITAKDFRTMARSKEFNVVTEALKNNVIIIGIEDYYRLLNDAR